MRYRNKYKGQYFRILPRRSDWWSEIFNICESSRRQALTPLLSSSAPFSLPLFFFFLSLLFLLLPPTPLNPAYSPYPPYTCRKTHDSKLSQLAQTYLSKFSVLFFVVRGSLRVCENFGAEVGLQLNQEISKDSDLNCLNCSFYRSRICITRAEVITSQTITRRIISLENVSPADSEVMYSVNWTCFRRCTFKGVKEQKIV